MKRVFLGGGLGSCAGGIMDKKWWVLEQNNNKMKYGNGEKGKTKDPKTR